MGQIEGTSANNRLDRGLRGAIQGDMGRQELSLENGVKSGCRIFHFPTAPFVHKGVGSPFVLQGVEPCPTNPTTASACPARFPMPQLPFAPSLSKGRLS